MMVVLLVTFLAIVVILILFRRSKLRRISERRNESSKVSLEKKVQEARTQLLYADETVRTAKDEVVFATAEFGINSVDQLKMNLDNAERGLAYGYQLLAQINEATSLGDQAKLAEQLQQVIKQVIPPLAASLEKLQEQRNAEASLESRVADLQERIADMERQISASEGELVALQTAYPPQAVASLLDNPEQARKLLDSARSALERMQLALTQDRTSALQKAELCQRQIALAKLQVDAIMNARQTIENASQMLAGAIGSITQDLNDVTRLVQDQSAFQPLVEEARAAISEAQQAARGQGDAVAALERIHNAEETLDAALAPLRSAEDARNRVTSQARERINQVEILVNQADAEIQRRRSNLSLEARSNITQARSQLNGARQIINTDPQQALRMAAEAERFARQAIQKAQSVSSFGDGEDFDMEDVMLWTTVIGSALGGALGQRHRGRRMPTPPRNFGSHGHHPRRF